jgi:LSD1 subclass zinc finger protein
MASLVCATCRKLIPPGTNAIRCTVASCNTGRMKLRFCSVACWEKHVPTARHRKASYVVEGAGTAAAAEAPAGDSTGES